MTTPLHIEPCARDSEVLAQLTGPNYHDVVVPKPWGWEFLIYETPQTATWYLRLLPYQETSMHCHQKKQTTLLVVTGAVIVTTFLRRDYLNAGDSIILAPGVFHSTHATFQQGAEVIEVETPPDKTDLVRMVDTYDREKKGYEKEFRAPEPDDGYFTLNRKTERLFGKRSLRLRAVLRGQPYPVGTIPLRWDTWAPTSPGNDAGVFEVLEFA